MLNIAIIVENKIIWWAERGAIQAFNMIQETLLQTIAFALCIFPLWLLTDAFLETNI